MSTEQQSIAPNFASFPTPNPNPIPIPNLNPNPNLDSNPLATHTDDSQCPIVEESQHASAIELVGAPIDSTAQENMQVGETTNETGNVVLETTAQPVNPPVNAVKFNCEVCNVTCDTKDMLEIHMKGKKHLKFLRKVSGSSVNAPNMVPPPVEGETGAGEVESEMLNLSQNGAAPESLILCAICNVVCNSRETFQAHVSGKKHMAKSIVQQARESGFVDATLDPGSSSPKKPDAVPSEPSQKKPDAVPSEPSQKKPEAFTCELCKISCTSREGLDMHLAGKKHKKEESRQAINPQMTVVASQDAPPTEPMVNPAPAEGKTVNSQAAKPVCELCGITCDTDKVFNIHLTGKKHLKNMEKSERLIGPTPAPGTEPAAEPMVIGPQEEGKIVNSGASKGKGKGKRAGTTEDMETKKQRILENGTSADAVQTCNLCNVVCNSQKVYFSHLASAKHLIMATKQAEAQAVPNVQGS